MTERFPENTTFHAASWVLPVSATPIQNGFVAVSGERIIAIGSVSELPESVSITVQPGTVLTPGLVNTHIHLEQSYPNVIPKTPDEPFGSWLLNVVRQNREHGSSAEKKARSEAGVAELLATGTTCVNDIASGSESLAALSEGGLRGYVTIEAFHPANAPVQIQFWLDAYADLKRANNGHARLIPTLSPHSPYNFSPLAWQALLAAEDLPFIHAHAAESEDETWYVQGRPSAIPELHQKIIGKIFEPLSHADSPIAYLKAYGLLNNRTILAHVVHTSVEDRADLAEAGVTVTHCPRSNLMLLGKTLNYADWENTLVEMGLGTDGRVSTETLDLRDEARCAMALHGWSAQKALEMMTLSGAKALHLDAEIGSLESGKAADLVEWRLPGPVDHDPEMALMLPATQVQHVWTDGVCRFSAETN